MWNFSECDSKEQLIQKLREQKARVDKSIDVMSQTPSKLPPEVAQKILSALNRSSYELMMWIYELAIG
jgi:hypothetical protein